MDQAKSGDFSGIDIDKDMKSLNMKDCTSAQDSHEGSQGIGVPPPSLIDDPVLLQKFQQERLKQVLKIQETERNDSSFSRDCLFCRQHFTGNRSLLFEHLSRDHNFHVGAADNIVFGNELLDVLSRKLKNLQCFYCEKTFKDWMVLKEHMRKKLHKRINPKNKTYDKFYLINYLEFGKNWIDVQNEDNSYDLYDEEDELNDEEMECQDDEKQEFLCLFCEFSGQSLSDFFGHMKFSHGFDYETFKKQYNLDFYKQVKLINYIRRQTCHKICMICEQQFKESKDLLRHMNLSFHLQMFPDESKWNQPMFYFPTYEDDSLLCALEDESEDISQSTEATVVPEDVNVCITSLLSDEQTRQILLQQG